MSSCIALCVFHGDKVRRERGENGASKPKKAMRSEFCPSHISKTLLEAPRAERGRRRREEQPLPLPISLGFRFPTVAGEGEADSLFSSSPRKLRKCPLFSTREKVCLSVEKRKEREREAHVPSFSPSLGVNFGGSGLIWNGREGVGSVEKKNFSKTLLASLLEEREVSIPARWARQNKFLPYRRTLPVCSSQIRKMFSSRAFSSSESTCVLCLGGPPFLAFTSRYAFSFTIFNSS